MDIGQLKSARTITYVILVISISIVASEPGSLTYTCNANGISSIVCPSNNCSGLAIIYEEDAHRKFCKGKGTHLLSSCTQAQNKMSLLVLYEEVTAAQLIGGNLAVHYRLNCIDDGNKVTRNATVFSAKPVTVPKHNQNENIVHGFTLGLTKDGKVLTSQTVIHIGDTLKLQMKGTGVVIDPMNCSAYSTVKHDLKVVLWEKDNLSCNNKETAIIGSAKWSHIAGDPSGISIDMFAFRFTTYAEVVIGCTAFVCSDKKKDKCTQTCVEAVPTPAPGATNQQTHDGGRKRRDIAKVGKDDSRRILSSSVSFSVSDEALENGSTGLPVSNVKFMAVGLVLMFIL